MAESKHAAEPEVAAVPEPTPAPAKLGRASESGDAAVQNLLGERSIHASNGDDERVADVDRRLAELGYAAR
jgi:hypothetical protein